VVSNDKFLTLFGNRSKAINKPGCCSKSIKYAGFHEEADYFSELIIPP